MLEVNARINSEYLINLYFNPLHYENNTLNRGTFLYVLKAFSFVFAFNLISCNQPGQTSTTAEAPDASQIEAAVNERFGELVKYASSGDLDHIFEMFDESAGGSYVDAAWRHDSFDELVKVYRENFKVKEQNFGTPKTKVIVLSSTSALMSVTADVSLTNLDGESFKPRAWALTALWILKDGKWKIHSYHQYTAPEVPV